MSFKPSTYDNELKSLALGAFNNLYNSNSFSLNIKLLRGKKFTKIDFLHDHYTLKDTFTFNTAKPNNNGFDTKGIVTYLKIVNLGPDDIYYGFNSLDRNIPRLHFRLTDTTTDLANVHVIDRLLAYSIDIAREDTDVSADTNVELMGFITPTIVGRP